MGRREAAKGEGVIIAVDPGQDKCGLAALTLSGKVVFQKVVPRPQLAQEVSQLHQAYRPEVIAVGNRTGAREVVRLLESLNLGVPIRPVEEDRSSEEGRRRYFAANPPRGWRRLLPTSLQTPARPHDDYVAVVLGERYLKQRAGLPAEPGDRPHEGGM